MVSVNQQVTYCIDLTATGSQPCPSGNNYTWSVAGGTFTGGTTSTGQNGCYTFTPTQAGNYMLTATCGYGGSCSVAETINIEISAFCVGQADGTSCGAGSECCGQMCVMTPSFTITQQ